MVDAQAGEMVFKERAEKAEAERDAAHRAWEPLTEQRNAAHAKLDRIAEALGRSLLTSGVHDGLPEAVADLRAQVARLREAATAVVSADAPPTEYGGCFAECSSAACIAYDQAHAGLRAALAEPGPTLEH